MRFLIQSSEPLGLVLASARSSFYLAGAKFRCGFCLSASCHEQRHRASFRFHDQRIDEGRHQSADPYQSQKCRESRLRVSAPRRTSPQNMMGVTRVIVYPSGGVTGGDSRVWGWLDVSTCGTWHGYPKSLGNRMARVVIWTQRIPPAQTLALTPVNPNPRINNAADTYCYLYEKGPCYGKSCIAIHNKLVEFERPQVTRKNSQSPTAGGVRAILRLVPTTHVQRLSYQERKSQPRCKLEQGDPTTGNTRPTPGYQVVHRDWSRIAVTKRVASHAGRRAGLMGPYFVRPASVSDAECSSDNRGCRRQPTRCSGVG